MNRQAQTRAAILSLTEDKPFSVTEIIRRVQDNYLDACYSQTEIERQITILIDSGDLYDTGFGIINIAPKVS